MASGKAIIKNIKATYSMIVSYFCRTYIRQLLQNSAAAALLGSFRSQYRIDRPGGDLEQPGNMGHLLRRGGNLPPDAVRQRNCQPRLPAGEPDTRFPAVYSGLFPCSEGVGGSAHRNPRARNCLSPRTVPFEICEYGRQPKPEKIKVLFPFLP
jgi:hypothetical protein